jgi:hypothetical protein
MTKSWVTHRNRNSEQSDRIQLKNNLEESNRLFRHLIIFSRVHTQIKAHILYLSIVMEYRPSNTIENF